MISRDGRFYTGNRKPVIARTQRDLEAAFALDSELHPLGQRAKRELVRAKLFSNLMAGESEETRRRALAAVNHARLVAAEWGLAGGPV